MCSLLSSRGCSIATYNLYERIQLNEAMPNPNIDAPSWLRQMENILEELNEGVVIVDIPAKRAIARAQRSDDVFGPASVQFKRLVAPRVSA